MASVHPICRIRSRDRPPDHNLAGTLELRPVYHRLEDRIRAHVILCWLALLLVRIVETTTGDTWNRIREDLQELHVGTFEGPTGTFRQRTEITPAQRDVLDKLGVDAPKK